MGDFKLKNTTLKDRGLTGGRSIIRFCCRVFDVEKLEKLNEDFKMKLNKKFELDENFRKIEKPNIIVQKEIIQGESVIISQPIDID